MFGLARYYAVHLKLLYKQVVEPPNLRVTLRQRLLKQTDR